MVVRGIVWSGVGYDIVGNVKVDIILWVLVSWVGEDVRGMEVEVVDCLF